MDTFHLVSFLWVAPWGGWVWESNFAIVVALLAGSLTPASQESQEEDLAGYWSGRSHDNPSLRRVADCRGFSHYNLEWSLTNTRFYKHPCRLYDSDLHTATGGYACFQCKTPPHIDLSANKPYSAPEMAECCKLEEIYLIIHTHSFPSRLDPELRAVSFLSAVLPNRPTLVSQGLELVFHVV